jgi:hypothetical protein
MDQDLFHCEIACLGSLQCISKKARTSPGGAWIEPIGLPIKSAFRAARRITSFGQM